MCLDFNQLFQESLPLDSERRKGVKLKQFVGHYPAFEKQNRGSSKTKNGLHRFDKVSSTTELKEIIYYSAALY